MKTATFMESTGVYYFSLFHYLNNNFDNTFVIIFIESENFPESITNNIKLIDPIPGIGRLTDITLISEIGDIDGFIKPKHIVAFFGIDSFINELSNFKGDDNKISKSETNI